MVGMRPEATQRPGSVGLPEAEKGSSDFTLSTKESYVTESRLNLHLLKTSLSGE